MIVYDAPSPSETSRRFRRELLRRVHEELLLTADRESGPVEQRLLQQVAQIVRRCEDELLNGHRQSLSVPDLDRRPSVDSAASSLRSVSHTAAGPSSLPLPAPMPAPIAHPSALESAQNNTTWLPECGYNSTYDGPSNDQVLSEPAGGIVFAPVVWHDQTYGTFGAGIDWEAVFSGQPPDVEMDMDGEGGFGMLGPGSGVFT